ELDRALPGSLNVEKKAENPHRWLMPGECGAFSTPASSILPPSHAVALLQQRRPSRIGRVARRLQDLLVTAGDIDRVEHRPGVAAGIAEEHDHAPVRRPGRSFVVIALGENALARSVRAHDADGEPALRLLGEGDIVAARRPYRRRIGALAEADALRLAAVRRHDVDLLLSAAIGLEADARAVGRIGGRGVDDVWCRNWAPPANRNWRGRLETLGCFRAQVRHKQIGIAAALQTEDHALAVRREARAEGHAGEVADDFALPGLNVHEIDFGIALAIGHVGDGVGRRREPWRE